MRTTTLEEAQYYFRLAYTCQMAGQLDEAIDLYRRSIDVHATAEAHCFLGWTYSFKSEYEKAIEECKRAIILDPDFGNPYNDIGAYLIHLERYDEAIPWLELACSSKRYNARHYPHFNLGRVYERTGAYREAVAQYRTANKLDPGYVPASQAAERIVAWMN